MDYFNFFKRIEEDWSRVEPSIDMGNSLLILSILRAGFELQRKTEEILSIFDLNTATYGVLVTLYRSAPSEGLTPTELSKHVLVSPGSMTNRIDRLEERGLVERVQSNTDRRSSKVRLTGQGMKLLKEVLPLHLENEDLLIKNLSSKEKADLHYLVLKLLSQLER